MEKVFFNNIRKEIIGLLDNAEENVYIAMAWFTSAELFDTLISCLERGVRVQLIILDNTINFMYFAPDFNQFIKHKNAVLKIAGLNIGFMHHKFCVIDNKIVITGSYNWTYYAETRNIENIVITDDKDTVNQYKEEFTSLFHRIEKEATSTPRFDISDVETSRNINFDDLNYEIESICVAQNLPIKKVLKTNTIVNIVETKRTPISKCNIGLHALDKDDNEVFDVYIREGEKLPYESNEEKRYYDSEHNQEFPCDVISGFPIERETWVPEKKEDLMKITKGIKKENLEIRFKMTLNIDGSLRVDVRCPDSGQTMMISIIEPNFVKYE